jgi:hypothetical protein
MKKLLITIFMITITITVAITIVFKFDALNMFSCKSSGAQSSCNQGNKEVTINNN